MILMLDFLLPLFGFLTAALITLLVFYMISIKTHEGKSKDRHEHSQQQSLYRHQDLKVSQDLITSAVEKVGKKIDSEVIPRLESGFSRKDSTMFKATEEGLQKALGLIGLVCESVGGGDTLFLVGLQGGDENEPEDFKVYFYLSVDIEAQDLLVECYAYEMLSYCESDSKLLLSLNDKFKISCFAVEEVGGRFFLKSQNLLFLNDGYFDSKRLEHTIACLYAVMKEAVELLELEKTPLEFVGPNEYMRNKVAEYTTSKLAHG